MAAGDEERAPVGRRNGVVGVQAGGAHHPRALPALDVDGVEGVVAVAVAPHQEPPVGALAVAAAGGEERERDQREKATRQEPHGSFENGMNATRLDFALSEYE